ncbi:uncharacterized protein LOC128306808 [Anopheles moucheti]|uniref:uncharacterized protein LOC128306808 n=1 Tax=Anopheles moucheti TaxID=186751 RepID=UPI0022F0597E|nr:uncharacterized protein LOC128306808 [Anopheles moucheti]XP_052900383.1 uncharacterized protein LOC128306808 [Anopheles moucheti]
MMDSENIRVALENVESFLLKFTSQSTTLLDAMCGAATILKQTDTRSFNSLCTGTYELLSSIAAVTQQQTNSELTHNNIPSNFPGIYDLPSTIAIELRHAAETADSKQFFICSQKIKTSSCIQQMLMEEAKQARRKIDSLALRNTTSLERLRLQKLNMYLEQAFNILYMLNLQLHEIQLTANALFVHGLKEDKPHLQEIQEMDGLKDAIARFVSIVSTKNFRSTFTTTL